MHKHCIIKTAHKMKYMTLFYQYNRDVDDFTAGDYCMYYYLYATRG